MQFAIIAVTLLVHGVVSAVVQDEPFTSMQNQQTRYKRSVYSGFPYAYGYHMPIEPMPMTVDRTFERAADSYSEAYQPAAFWDRYYHYTATTPKPTAYPRPDVVYRTLMQRAADSNADAPDRGGNVAIQLTANLVYGYRPSDVAEPVAFPRVEASVRFARPDGGLLYADEPRRPVAVAVQPQSPGAAESAVIVVALSSDMSHENDDAAAAASPSVIDYDRLIAERRWMQGPAYSTTRDVESAAAAADDGATDVTDQLLDTLFKSLLEPDEPTVTSAEAGRSENEIDGGFFEPTTTAEPTEDIEAVLVFSSAGEEEIKCDEDEENDCGSQSTTTEVQPEIVVLEISCDEDDENDCGLQSTTTEIQPEIEEIEITCGEEDDDCGPQSTTTEVQPEIVGSEISCDEEDDDCGPQSTTTENQPEIEESEISCDEEDDDCAQSTTTEATTPTAPAEGEENSFTLEMVNGEWVLNEIEISKDTDNGIESAETTITPVQKEDELQNSTPIQSEPEIKVTWMNSFKNEYPSFYNDDDDE